MDNFAILRIEKRKDLGSVRRCADHHLRASPTPNADSRRGIRVLVGHRKSSDAVQQINAATKPLIKRRDAVRCLDIFVGASPSFFASGGSLKEFEQRAVEFARTTFGAQNLILAVCHEDESTPHIQMMVTPITPTGKLAASYWLDGPKKLRALQDSLAAIMAPLGLKRGIKGSKARHEDVKRWYTKLLPALQRAEEILRAALAKRFEADRRMKAVQDAEAEIAEQKSYLSKIFSALTEQEKQNLKSVLDSSAPTRRRLTPR